MLQINSTFRVLGLTYLAMRINATKRGFHYVFLLPGSITPLERVAIEAILGDDPMRAAMNFARARNHASMNKFWRQRWNILYDWKVKINA